VNRRAAVLSVFVAASLWAGAAKAQARVERVESEAVLKPLPFIVGGRVAAKEDGLTYQWPGVYFEAAFTGGSVFFRVGAGDQILHLLIDGQRIGVLRRPDAGLYRITGLARGAHEVRIEVVSEHQAGSARFGGFALDADGVTGASPRRARRIEFIGDSHTAGYGAALDRRECTAEEVWASTDNSLAFGPLTARRYDADYQINAISGRGVVRNYGGAALPTLPEAYPYALFDGETRYEASDWSPDVVVVDLGTNDFSTPLASGERWASREALRADFEAGYVRFAETLRARYGAFLILLTPPSAEDEIAVSVGRVAERLKAAGEDRLAVLATGPLAFTACDWHPSRRDHEQIAGVLAAFLDAHPEVWNGGGS
jgi:lysophospholipase L1-like esterase